MDFSIHMFNPQPDPPAHAGNFADGSQQSQRPHYYKYELKNVQVTSFQTGGATGGA